MELGDTNSNNQDQVNINIRFNSILFIIFTL